MKAVRGNTSLLASLAGVKGLSGCAVRQNSKSDLVQGPDVLKLEEQPIALLALGLLHLQTSAAIMEEEEEEEIDNNDNEKPKKC